MEKWRRPLDHPMESVKGTMRYFALKIINHRDTEALRCCISGKPPMRAAFARNVQSLSALFQGWIKSLFACCGNTQIMELS